MVKTDNGMKVAEKDLELRGSGDFFGTAQHGIPEFKIENTLDKNEEKKCYGNHKDNLVVRLCFLSRKLGYYQHSLDIMIVSFKLLFNHCTDFSLF